MRGARSGTALKKVMSARIALPDHACVVKLADWLPAGIAQKFATPENTGEGVGQRHFNMSMTEWRDD